VEVRGGGERWAWCGEVEARAPFIGRAERSGGRRPAVEFNSAGYVIEARRGVNRMTD
jgi:hypothetical protein